MALIQPPHIPYKHWREAETPDPTRETANWIEVERWAVRLGEQIPTGGGTYEPGAYWYLGNGGEDTSVSVTTVSFLRWATHATDPGDSSVYNAVLHNVGLADLSGGFCTGITIQKSGLYQLTFDVGFAAPPLAANAVNYTAADTIFHLRRGALSEQWASAGSSSASTQSFGAETGYAYSSITTMCPLEAGDQLLPAVNVANLYGTSTANYPVVFHQYHFTGILIAAL
jgi:hypothetical protein